jgi:hypothetical protein
MNGAGDGWSSEEEETNMNQNVGVIRSATLYNQNNNGFGNQRQQYDFTNNKKETDGDINGFLYSDGGAGSVGGGGSYN